MSKVAATCKKCGKTFARSDSLLRHEKTHLTTHARGPIHRVTDSTFRACNACARARSRCSGGRPCGRCELQNLDCEYTKRRRGTVIPDNDEIHLTSEPRRATHNPADDMLDPQNADDAVLPVSQNLGDHGQVESSLEPPTQTTLDFSMKEVPSYLDLTNTVTLDATASEPRVTPHLVPTKSVSKSPSGLDDATMVQVPNQNIISHDSDREPLAAPNQFSFENTFSETARSTWMPPNNDTSSLGVLARDFASLLPSVQNFDFEDGFGNNSADSDSYWMSGHIALDHDMSASMPYSTSQLLPSGSMHDIAQPAYGSNTASSAVEASASQLHSSRRREYSGGQEGFSIHHITPKDYQFPDTSMFAPKALQNLCSDAAYSSAYDAFARLCLDDYVRTPFSTAEFPGQPAFNGCIEHYLDNFDQAFPLIHRASLKEDMDWILLLAMAAVGSNFVRISLSIRLRTAFQEFLRRVLDDVTDLRPDCSRDLPIAQARVLNLVCLMQSDSPELRSLAPRYHADLSRWCLESGILQTVSSSETYSSDRPRSQSATMPAWYTWIQQESKTRTGYFIWMLDCAMGYMCNTRPLCNVDDAQAPLPCSEPLWNADNADAWVQLALELRIEPSLCAAMEEIYSKKKVDPKMSEISILLIVHAIYSKTWEVGAHIRQPLSIWTTISDGRTFRTPSRDDFWLPLYPQYANWRNSACDCIDTLHWHAIGVVGHAGGYEHHVVLHMHLARLALITPFQEIQDLLFLLIDPNTENSQALFYVHDGSYQRRTHAKLAKVYRLIHRWLGEDQYKARLAVYHAGNVFWHIRKFSKSSFFDPTAIYLASLVLWTYGSFKQVAAERHAAVQQQVYTDTDIRPTRVERFTQLRSSHRNSNSARPPAPGSVSVSDPFELLNSSTSPFGQAISITTSSSNTRDLSESEDEQQPDFIHLDRPCDDEMVQHFVRNGQNMIGHMSHVGDICMAPGKILLEGAKLLRTRSTMWGASRGYHHLLLRLAATDCSDIANKSTEELMK